MLARKRISTSEAARRLGVNQMWLHRRVAGKIPFDVGEIVALADLLDTPVETFFEATANVSKRERIRKTFFSYLRPDLRFPRHSPGLAA